MLDLDTGVKVEHPVMACDTTSAPVPTAAPAIAAPRWTLAALTAAAFASVTIELSPTGLLPAIAADLAVTTSAAGALVATWAVTLAATSFALVRATRRLPRQRVVAVALLVCGAATLATAAAPTLPVAVGARVLGAAAHGLGLALLTLPPALVLLRDRTPGGTGDGGTPGEGRGWWRDPSAEPVVRTAVGAA